MPLVCSPRPAFSLCLALWGLLASLLPWLPLLLLLLRERWSCLTLRRCAAAWLCLTSPLCLSPHTRLCWIIAAESARERDRDRTAGRLRACTLHSTAEYHSCFLGLLKCSAGNSWTGEGSGKEFFLLSLRCLPLFIPGTECRGGGKREGLRVGLQT